MEECALCASSAHDVHHASVCVNVVIGVLVVHCELHVDVRVHGIPLVVCDDAVVDLTLGLIALVVIVVFVVAIFHRILLYWRYTVYTTVTAQRQSAGFLIRQARCPILHLTKALSFFCLCPREIRDLGFTFRKIFTNKVRNDQAEPLEVNTFKGNRIKAIFNRLPCLTSSHQRPKTSIPVGTQCSRGD